MFLEFVEKSLNVFGEGEFKQHEFTNMGMANNVCEFVFAAAAF